MVADEQQPGGALKRHGVRIAIAGGTGIAGRYAVRAARGAGHETVVLTRHSGVDLTTGKGLDTALRGVQAIIDASNTPERKAAPATEFFTAVARRLQEVGARNGAGRIVVLSVLGIDDIPYGYYQAKLAQEAAAREGPVPVSVLRSTQFYEFAGQVLARRRFGPVALAPRMVLQPIAARTVGEILVEEATSAVAGGCTEVAGPVREYLPDMVQMTVHRHGKRAMVLPFTLRGEAGAAMRDGALLPPDGVRLAGPTFVDWLDGPDPLEVTR